MDSSSTLCRSGKFLFSDQMRGFVRAKVDDPSPPPSFSLFLTLCQVSHADLQWPLRLRLLRGKPSGAVRGQARERRTGYLASALLALRKEVPNLVPFRSDLETEKLPA